MIERGQVCWMESARAAGRRPVLVLQSDAFNRSAIPTVLVAPLAQGLRLAEAPGNVVVPARASGLPRDTVIVVSEITALEPGQLRETRARLDDGLMGRIGEGVRLVLGL